MRSYLLRMNIKRDKVFTVAEYDAVCYLLMQGLSMARENLSTISESDP